jgi:sulfur carrier protein ThiS
VASEVLSCDVAQIHEKMLSEACASHLERLLSFPAPKGPLNPVLLGYYCKVISAMFKRSPADFLNALDQHAPQGRTGYLGMLVAHLDMQSTVDLIATLTTPLDTLNSAPPPPPMMLGGSFASRGGLSANGGRSGRGSGDGEGKEEVESEPEHWLDVAAFASSLLDAVSTSESGEVHALAATTFGGLVEHYGWAVMVASQTLVSQLVDVALGAEQQTARTSAICMISELLNLFAHERMLPSAGTSSTTAGGGMGGMGMSIGGLGSPGGPGGSPGGADDEAQDEAAAAAKAEAKERERQVAERQLAPLLDAIGAQVEGFVAQLNHEPVSATTMRARVTRDTLATRAMRAMLSGSWQAVRWQLAGGWLAVGWQQLGALPLACAHVREVAKSRWGG